MDLTNFTADLNSDYPLVKFTVERDFDTTFGQDYVMTTDDVVLMSFAIRQQPVEVLNEDDTFVLGDPTRRGYFNVILHDDETTSYWGVRGAAVRSINSSLSGLLTATVALTYALSFF